MRTRLVIGCLDSRVYCWSWSSEKQKLAFVHTDGRARVAHQLEARRQLHFGANEHATEGGDEGEVAREAAVAGRQVELTSGNDHRQREVDGDLVVEQLVLQAPEQLVGELSAPVREVCLRCRHGALEHAVRYREQQ